MKRMITVMSAGRIGPLIIGAAALSACGGIIPAAEAPPPAQAPAQATAQARADERVQIGSGRDYPRAYREPSPANSTRQPTRIASAPMSHAPHPRDHTCFADLNETGATFTPVADSYAAPGCNKLGTVQLSALAGDTSEFGVSNLGPVKCETAKAFTAWARFGVDRAARQILGSPLARIETMGSYSCRNVAGTNRRSSHATANAIDVSGFTLEDGRRIVLKSDWDGGTAAEREFLRVVQKSACKRFGTVLGPEYDAAHEDHFHLEGTGSKYCR